MRRSEFTASNDLGNELGSDENRPTFQQKHNPYRYSPPSSNLVIHGSPTCHEIVANRQLLQDHQARHGRAMSATSVQVLGFSEQLGQSGLFTQDIPVPHSASVVSPPSYTTTPSGPSQLSSFQSSMHGRTHHSRLNAAYSDTNQYIHGPVSNTNDYVHGHGDYFLGDRSCQLDTQYRPDVMTGPFHPNRPGFAANISTENPLSLAEPSRSPIEQCRMSDRTLISSSTASINSLDAGYVELR